MQRTKIALTALTAAFALGAAAAPAFAADAPKPAVTKKAEAPKAKKHHKKANTAAPSTSPSSDSKGQ